MREPAAPAPPRTPLPAAITDRRSPLSHPITTPPDAAPNIAGGALRPIGLDSSPLHGELLGVERLEERARALAAELTLSRDPRHGPPRLLRRLTNDADALRHAYRVLAADVRLGEPGTPAAEWLLDNFHLIEGELREIRRYLPTRYYLELPKLAARGRARSARVYAMAVELLRFSDARLDGPRIERFMKAYQTVAPLSIGELWAWPSMLRLALIEHLEQCRRLGKGAREQALREFLHVGLTHHEWRRRRSERDHPGLRSR
jgi:hypothetical protein